MTFTILELVEYTYSSAYYAEASLPLYFTYALPSLPYAYFVEAWVYQSY